jgi:hypothetical protein
MQDIPSETVTPLLVKYLITSVEFSSSGARVIIEIFLQCFPYTSSIELAPYST